MPAREILSWHGWHALDSGVYAMGGKAKKSGRPKGRPLYSDSKLSSLDVQRPDERPPLRLVCRNLTRKFLGRARSRLYPPRKQL
jgi:hypothetical protein